MYICLCKGITESDLQKFAENAQSPEPATLGAAFGLTDEECCGRCAENLSDLVALATGVSTCPLASSCQIES